MVGLFVTIARIIFSIQSLIYLYAFTSNNHYARVSPHTKVFKQNKIEVYYRGISILERKADLWPKDFYPYLWNRQIRAKAKCHQMV